MITFSHQWKKKGGRKADGTNRKKWKQQQKETESKKNHGIVNGKQKMVEIHVIISVTP